MKKAILLQTIMLLFVAAVAVAQPYESCFGNESTEHNVFGECLGPCGLYEFSFEYKTDSIRGTIKYIVMESYDGYYREDTLTGSLWWVWNEQEFLLMDMSLEEGDFIPEHFGVDYYGSNYIVESIYFDTYGRKVLRTNKELSVSVYDQETFQWKELNVNLEFIEGIGATDGWVYSLGYLLCAHKDGKQTYANTELNGVCHYTEPPVGIFDEKQKPFSELINTQSELAVKFITAYSGTIRLIATTGQSINYYAVENSTYFSENISALNPGIYILNFKNTTGHFFNTKIVKY